MIDLDLLEILACPRCKGELALETAHRRLVCAACGLGYPLEAGIPVLLLERAEPWPAAPEQERD